MTFRSGPHPRAFAHRGWHTGDLAGCENTLPAFRRALAEGFVHVETDVHVTSDGVLVAFHDDVLDRVTDASGPIAALPYREVRRARIGGREPIPTLAEVFEACPDALINIDPKSDAAVEPLLELLRQSGLWDRVCVGSFSDRRLAAIRRAAPAGLATSVGPRAVAGLLAAGLLGAGHLRPGPIAAQVPVRSGRIPVVTRRFLSAARRSGLEVHVWTIDDPGQMHQLLDLGVDGIMTDRPDLLRAVLDERGLWQERG